MRQLTLAESGLGRLGLSQKKTAATGVRADDALAPPRNYTHQPGAIHPGEH